jgi:hypothetical protein
LLAATSPIHKSLEQYFMYTLFTFQNEDSDSTVEKMPGWLICGAQFADDM